jgi:predicted thioesterase
LEFLIGIRSHRLPHTQVPEISGKLHGKKSAFTWATSFLLRSLSAKSYKLFNQKDKKKTIVGCESHAPHQAPTPPAFSSQFLISISEQQFIHGNHQLPSASIA